MYPILIRWCWRIKYRNLAMISTVKWRAPDVHSCGSHQRSQEKVRLRWQLRVRWRSRSLKVTEGYGGTLVLFSELWRKCGPLSPLCLLFFPSPISSYLQYVRLWQPGTVLICPNGKYSAERQNTFFLKVFISKYLTKLIMYRKCLWVAFLFYFLFFAVNTACVS